MRKFTHPKAWIDPEQYREWYRQSLAEPDVFWAKQAEEFLIWFKSWDKVYSGALKDGNVHWFEGTLLNRLLPKLRRVSIFEAL